MYKYERPVPPQVIDPAMRYSLEEASVILRQSIAKTHIDLRSGKLASFKDGGRRYVSGTELIRRSAPPAAQNASDINAQFGTMVSLHRKQL